jgi:hypothetical protein
LKEDEYGDRRLERIKTSDGTKLFDPSASAAGITNSEVNYWVIGLRWDPSKGPLHTSVTVTLAEWKNLIRARKRIATQVPQLNGQWHIDVDDDPVIAAGVE